MMALRVAPAVEEERAKEEDGIAEAAGSIVSTRGRFGRSWASLRWTEPTLMAPMMVEKGEKGMGM